MGCYHGYHSRGGAQGVGQATTHAVVSASILILFFDYCHHRGLLRVMQQRWPPSAQDRRPRAARNPSAASACSTASISTARAGESLVVIGGSGIGKSVLIKCILGLLQPEAGSIRDRRRRNGRGMRRAARERLMQKFGMLFQGSALFDSLQVWENVAFGLIQGRGMAAAARQARSRSRSWPRSGSGREVGELRPGRAVGRHAKARRAGARDRRRARDHLFRRADHRPRPDHGRCDQRPDRQMRARSGRDGGLDHPRHGRARARSPTASRCCTRGGSSGTGRRPRSTIPAIRLSTSSSMAAPRGRSRWRSARLTRAATIEPMARAQPRYACQQCGAAHPKWAGRCEACGAWNSLVEELPRAAPPKGLGGAWSAARRPALDFVGCTATSAAPPRRHDRHRRIRPGVRRRAGAGLGDPGRRRSRASANRPCCCRPRPRSPRQAAAQCAYITGEEAIDQVRLRAAAARRRRRAGAARRGDQRARHRGLARRADAPRSRRHRFDPDDVSRHARQRARHRQPGARRGAGADRARQAARLRAGAGRPRHQGGR